MRAAVLSDIHGNLTALEALLDDLQTRAGVDELWCLGDIAGYGPYPGECLALLREYPLKAVAGNHDLGLTGRVEMTNFTGDARRALDIQRELVNEETLGFFSQLPLRIKNGDITLLHASPRDPTWEYLHTAMAAAESFRCFDTAVCLCGHTHRPIIYRQTGTGKCRTINFPPDRPVNIEGSRFIINPGSVGQPRDGVPLSSYVIFDEASGLVERHLVAYDIVKTQTRMLELDLPPRLIARLDFGF